VACGEDGIASFDRIRYRHHDASVFLYAFDLIELDGDDLRREPLAVRKSTLASLLARAARGLRLNEHMDEANGPLVFAHAWQARARGHREQAAQLVLPLGTITGLDQEQEPDGAGGAARRVAD
jgi:bifunctional non-homologous end joining protein LigD